MPRFWAKTAKELVTPWWRCGTLAAHQVGSQTHTNTHTHSTILPAHYTFPAKNKKYWRKYLKENGYNKGVKITKKLWYRGLQMTDDKGRYFYAILTLQEDSQEGVWGVLDY